MRIGDVGQDQIVEERQWRSGVEIISHVNHSHVARVRTALGLSAAWGRPFDEIRAASHVLALRGRRRRWLGSNPKRPSEPHADIPPGELTRRRASSS